MMKQVKVKLPLRMLTLAGGLALSVSAFAQNITITGQVKDDSGEPVTGATISLGGKAVAVSDIDGNFTVKADKGASLSISYVGYTTQTVSATNNMVITLAPDSKTLTDVVVIGYGRAKKSDLTGSVTAIKPDELNHGLQTNAQDMISGKIAGVSVISNDGTPGGGAKIRVRGGSSLNASNDPLIVIDGLAMDSYGIKGLANPLSMVNPNDIESFTVLKDASATAIYGSRASNGVIIITTKKGRSGQKPHFSYNGNVSIAARKKTFDVMNGEEFTNYVKKLFGENSKAYEALGYLDKDGKQQFASTDWQDEIYRTAVQTDQNLTMTGGLKNMPYRVSLGYTNQPGIVKTSKFERFTGSFTLNPTLLNDHLRINLNGKGMLAKNRYADGDAIGAARNMDPTKPVTYAGNEVYHKFFGDYAQWYGKSEYKDDTWIYGNNSNATSNPMSILNLKDDRAISRTFIGNAEFDYAIHGFEDLHLHANAGMNVSNGKQTTTWSPYSTKNHYYGSYGWEHNSSSNLQLSVFAQYMKDLGGTKDLPLHHFDVMAGHEFQRFQQLKDFSSFGIYPSTNTEHAGEKYNVNNGYKVTNSKTSNRLESWFGRLNYTLLDRYMLTATFRADGSSRFNWLSTGDNQQWGFFPSVALAWRAKEETFLRDVKWLDDLKVRAGWGITGQQEGVGDYTYIATYTPNQNSHALYPLFGDGSTQRPDAYNNELTWEKTTTWNAGVDLAFLNERLVISADWYYRKTRDLINSVYVKPGANFRNKVLSNIGSLHNTGLELAITGRPVQTKDWKWEVNYNITYNENKIDELVSGGGNGDYKVETGGIGFNNIQAHAVGNSANAFYVYQQVYDKDGKPIENMFVDRNGNGVIDSGDRYLYYKPAPDVTMGIGSKLQYKNWDLSFSMRASLGNYMFNNNLSDASSVGKSAIFNHDFLGNRTKSAIGTGFQAGTDQQKMSDFFVENASFLKMDNITLGYSFATLFGAKLSGRVYGTVQNVFCITNYTGLDPEIPSGIDNNLYPRPITTVVGLNLNF